MADENALSPSVAALKTSDAASAPKKRKSDALDEEKDEMFLTRLDEIDDDDPRLATITETCNAVRRKIRNWTESGAMKVGEFQQAIGVSSKAYSSFMNRTGTWDGEGCDTYWKAAVFFKKRELLGLPLKAVKDRKKKAKLTTSDAAGDAGSTSAAGTHHAAAALLDVSGVTLEGEEDGHVPVFDTCDTVRKNVRAFIARDGITRAAFVRALSSLLPADSKVSDANLRYFLGLKGPTSGNTTTVFYAAYVFFEKRRIKDGKPKSKLRLEMEDVHDWRGMDLVTPANTSYICRAGSRPYIDKYGKMVVLPEL
jgi:hypothetical protein